MKIRKFDKSETELVRPFYAVKGDGSCADWLPEGSSYVVTIDDKIIASGCLLLTNSPMVFIEHLATNPLESQFTQGKALRFLAIELEKIAKNIGFTVILGLVPEDHFSLVEFYRRQGCVASQKLMRIVYKSLI